MDQIPVVVEVPGCWSCSVEPVEWVWWQDWMLKGPWWTVWKCHRCLPQPFGIVVPIDSWVSGSVVRVGTQL